MDGETARRLENGESTSSPRDSRIRMWAVAPGSESCTHPPEDVEYTGEDGLNLYFQCHRCGASLVAEEAVHLLARQPRT